MNRYENGKIYKITDIGYNKCYFGSTCEELSQRMARRRYKYPQYLKGKMDKVSVFKLFDEFGVENCKIELVELYPTNSKSELQRREGHYIKNNDCVNKRIEGRTDKEYREDNKEREQQRHNEYYINNKDKIQTKRDAHKDKAKDYNKQYREAHKERIKAQRKNYREDNKQNLKEQQRRCYETNKEERHKQAKQHYQENKDERNRQSREKYAENKEHVLEQRKAKYTCECGSMLRKDGKIDQLKTIKHQNWLKQQQQAEQVQEEQALQ